MRTIAFVSQKGGTSKSTLARHCAVAATRDGLRTVIMDCDQQATLRGWGAERGTAPEVIAETSTARRYVEQSLGQLRDDGIDVVMMDTPGSFEGGYSANAVALADYVVIPCRPSGEDTATFWETERRVTEARKPFGAVVTLATTTTGKPASDLMALFASSGVAVCPHVVHQRQIVPNSYANGLTVFELDRTSDSDERAAQEMQGVWEWLARVSGVRA